MDKALEKTETDLQSETVFDPPGYVGPPKPVTTTHWSDFPTTTHASALDAKAFRKNLDRRSVNRETLMEWLRDALTEGVDYGRLHINRNCQEGRNCMNPYHFSKPSLWKPGAEKICGMLGLTVNFPALPDYEQAVLNGVVLKQIMLRCNLLNESGQIVGEGIGARSIERDGGDLNKAIKMAEKSAMIDAVLRAGGLSEVFTQDMEDQATDESADPYAPGSAAGHNPWQNTSGINIETHCPLGKHKGKRWADVPADYLEWMITEMTDKPDLVRRAQRALDDASNTPEHPERPPEAGNRSLADAARELSMAATLSALESVWDGIDEQQRVPLRGTYQLRLKELESTTTGELPDDDA